MPSFTVLEIRQRDVALPGIFFADSTVTTLSRTAVGREILDGLRDRGGVLRMPTFYVSYQKGSAAQYTPPDAVFLSVETIEDGGVTVDQFLRDPKAQLDYLEREQAVIAHELKHADQARRSPFNADTYVLLKTNGARLVSAVEAYASGRVVAAPSSMSADDAGPSRGDGPPAGRFRRRGRCGRPRRDRRRRDPPRRLYRRALPEGSAGAEGLHLRASGRARARAEAGSRGRGRRDLAPRVKFAVPLMRNASPAPKADSPFWPRPAFSGRASG